MKDKEDKMTVARKLLQKVIKNRGHAGHVEVKCNNCGRHVFVGKCCNNPDIVEIG